MFGVLRGADTGAADAMVGNAMLRRDMYDGVVDVGRQVAVLRQLKDGRGPLEIPIRMQVSALGIALTKEVDRESRPSRAGQNSQKWQNRAGKQVRGYVPHVTPLT